VDQGVLSLLLTANILFKQRFIGKRFLFNNEVFDKKTGSLLGEVDLLFIIGSRVGIAEVKSDRGFGDKKQIDKLLDLSKRMDIDLIIFSTLKKSDSIEVRELVAYLKSKKVNISTLILTREVLFERNAVDIGESITYITPDSEHIIDPIIISKKSP